MDAKRKPVRFQDVALEQIRWADWYQLGVLEATVGVIIALSGDDKDIAAMWIIVGAVTHFVTVAFNVASKFQWKSLRSASIFAAVFSIAMLIDKLFVLGLMILTGIRYMSKVAAQ